MRKVFKPLACIFSIIATILMLIGIILALIHTRLFAFRPATWYFSAVNFLLFAILFHLAGKNTESETKS